MLHQWALVITLLSLVLATATRPCHLALCGRADLLPGLQMRFLELVVAGHQLSVNQAQQVLICFQQADSGPQLAQAAATLFASMQDPVDFWHSIVPLIRGNARQPLQQAWQTIGMFDVGNPTGRCHTELPLGPALSVAGQGSCLPTLHNQSVIQIFVIET